MNNSLPYRYFVFGSDNYYPSGGLGDLRGKFQTEEEAKAFIAKISRSFDIVEYYDMLRELEHGEVNY